MLGSCTLGIGTPLQEGLNGVNRQPSNGQKINRQPQEPITINRQNGIFLPSTVK